MSGPPPLPAASSPVPPPLVRLQFTLPTGFLTTQAFSGLTELWAAVFGDGGQTGQIQILQAQMAIVFAMHGDGTLSPTGTLTVTKTNGVAFGYFATGTDAAHLTGTIPFAVLPSPLDSETADTLLGRGGTGGTPQEISLGTNLTITGTTLSAADQVYTVGGTLPAAGTAGRRAFVSNALAPAFGSAVVGGGAVFTPVYDNGSAWIVG